MVQYNVKNEMLQFCRNLEFNKENINQDFNSHNKFR